MRLFIQYIILLFYSSCVFSFPPESLEFSHIDWLASNSKSTIDTSEVNKYARKALKYVPPVSRQLNFTPQLRIDNIKVNIDSAESICSSYNIEFPPLLHLARAEYFFLTSDFQSAMLEATLSLNKLKTYSDPEVLAKTLNFLGRYNLRTGQYSGSIDYFNSSISEAKKNNLKGFMPQNYNGLADVYYSLGNMEEYRNNLQKVIDAANAEYDTILLEDSYFRLGSYYTGKERNFNLSDSLLNGCLDLALWKKDTTYASLSLANIGWNFYLEKEFDSAIKYYYKSLVYSLSGKRYSYAANSFGNLGTIYRDMGDSGNSLKYYKKSIEQANLGNDIYSLSWVYQDMSEMYLRQKDTSNAYKTFVQFKKYSDSYILKTNSQGLTDARIQYEADTHNKEVELLSLRVRNQKLLIYGYTGLFILSIAIGLLLLSRAKINSKRRLSEMNRRISEITQANLRQQMNPHFIFNTLNSIQYYMYQHDKLATNNYLTKFSSLMRKVLENSQHTSVPLRDELDALNLYLELETIRFKDKFAFSIKVDEDIDTLQFKVPTMLIQPYVENSICHGLMPSEGKGLVKIDIKLEKEYLACTIEDNGIGREASRDKKTNNKKNHSSLGTQIVSSRLDLVNTLYGTSLKTLYTDLKNINGEPSGTRVEIQIPIMS
jgi:two-component system LytT family sensor kinase